MIFDRVPVLYDQRRTPAPLLCPSTTILGRDRPDPPLMIPLEIDAVPVTRHVKTPRQKYVVTLRGDSNAVGL